MAGKLLGMLGELQVLEVGLLCEWLEVWGLICLRIGSRRAVLGYFPIQAEWPS